MIIRVPMPAILFYIAFKNPNNTASRHTTVLLVRYTVYMQAGASGKNGVVTLIGVTLLISL